jgi:4'-phosphopantetheinyl transferase
MKNLRGAFTVPVWAASHSFRSLSSGEIQVWRIPLDATPEEEKSLWETLSPDERIRGDRFHFREHRRRFVVAHAALRHILSGTLGMEPSEICFDRRPSGKPFLIKVAPQDSLNFNLSHSGELALCAVSRSSDVGIDVEEVCPHRDWGRISERFFSSREVEILNAWPPSKALDLFYMLWASKEACLKATGQGLLLPLEHISMDVVPEEQDFRLMPSVDSVEFSHLFLHPFIPAQGYVAALVSTLVPERIDYWAHGSGPAGLKDAE